MYTYSVYKVLIWRHLSKLIIRKFQNITIIYLPVMYLQTGQKN